MKILITIMICSVVAYGCNSQNKGSKTAKLSDTLICPEISYEGYFGSPHGIKSYYDFGEGLECSKISRKPFLVYFSGLGSAQARKVEDKVLSDKEILGLIKSEFVITTLYVDARSKLEIDKQIVSELSGDTIKTYGLKQAYIEKEKFNDKEFPAFYIIDSNEHILAGPIYFTLDKKRFLEFLKEGKSKYYKLND